MKPHKCPVCNGEGKLYQSSINENSTAIHTGMKTCHACGGQGYILCPEDISPITKFDVICGGQRHG